MRRTFVLTAGAATLAAALVGCDASDGSDASVQRGRDVTAMVESTAPSFVMQAIVAGSLTVTDTGCFALDSGGTVRPVQFPFGTRLGDDGETVLVPGLEPIRVGDDVSGGGGYMDLENAPAECESTSEGGDSAIWQTVD
ncbi:hypothetical protein HQQ80_16910 [Microbacteriaceae bacterium VKM Ac-2855]|nr:hypothetical protein [Microbacteriaceae bacterium VKM Ac-2855]